MRTDSKLTLHPTLNDVQASEFVGVAVQTLRNWRSLNKGPAYLKLSPGPHGRVGYLLEDLQNFRENCRVDPGGAEGWDVTLHRR